MTEIIKSVFDKPRDAKLTIEELAEALYEGSPHLEFLAHKLCRDYRDPKAILPPWYAQAEHEKDFWRHTTLMIVKHIMDAHYVRYQEDQEENFTEIIETKGDH